MADSILYRPMNNCGLYSCITLSVYTESVAPTLKNKNDKYRWAVIMYTVNIASAQNVAYVIPKYWKMFKLKCDKKNKKV